MKKITRYVLLVMLMSTLMTVNAQVLNEDAAWPNTDWALTGTYSTAAGAVEADPTVDANFAFDDDDAGNPSDDTISAESPIINLTAAFNAGETWLSVSTTYAYYKLSEEEFLRFQYYDADGMVWVNWEPESLPGTLNDIFDDFCTGTPVPYTTVVLNIGGFTANQLANFQYRITFDDDPNGGAWEYGFCMQSPTITSAAPPSCPDPSGLMAVASSMTEVTLSWNELGSAALWNVEIVDITAGGSQTMTATDTGVGNPFMASGLTPENDYEFYVQSDCEGSGTSNWVGPFAFYTGYCIPVGTSDETYIDNFSTSGGITNISNLGSGFATANYQNNFDSGEVTGFATSSFDFNVEIVGGTLGCAIWVDWNNDLVFEVSEVVFSTTGYGNGPFTGSINVPGGTPNGDYRMRVMVDWNDPNPGDDDACGFGNDRGEVEDYKVVVGDAPTDELDYYNLQFPAVGSIGAGEDFLVFAQCYEAGLTDTTAGQAPGIEAWIGYSDSDTDPSGMGWTWIPADFNLEVGNNDEYFLNLGAQIPATGTYYYASRWRLNGALFTYGGIQADASYGGQWGNDNNISGVLTINPPANDDCSGAIALTPGADFASNPIDGTVVGATLAAETNDCGLNGPGVWYSVVVPGDGNITIETGPDAGTGNTAFDSVIEAYSGDCGTLTLIECDDDDADTFNFSILDLTGLTPGETIYIRVWEYNGDESEPFAISAYNATLSTDDFESKSSFKYFPNPVNESLTLIAQEQIQSVRIFNMLGQEVYQLSPNTIETKIETNSLNAGAYIVEVTINDVKNTIRVIKN